MPPDQNASSVIMVPPRHFHYNPQTARTNLFQERLNAPSLQARAMQEFETMVTTLERFDVTVLLLEQTKPLPDAVFPNNWFSTHLNSNGQTDLIIYSMLTPNRQDEVNIKGLITLLKQNHVQVGEVFDLRRHSKGVLEGTGSVVLDRKHRILYAARSSRTEEHMVKKLAKHIDYQPVMFSTNGLNNRPIYHTNVVLSILSNIVVVCMENIPHQVERQHLQDIFEKTHKKILFLSPDQINSMCANILELNNKKGESLVVMSQQAYQNLSRLQRKQLEQQHQIIPVDINTIETVGGGSARCMMAELFHINARLHPTTE